MTRDDGGPADEDDGREAGDDSATDRDEPDPDTDDYLLDESGASTDERDVDDGSANGVTGGFGERAAELGVSREQLGERATELGVTPEELGVETYEPDTGPRAEELPSDEPPRRIGVEAEALDRTRTPAERLRLPRATLVRLTVLVTVYVAVLAVLVAPGGPFAFPIVPVVVVVAFVFETTDSAAGMGFGTGLAPLLFVLGYDPLQIVPVLLVSETVTGLVAGLVHNDLENVTLSVRPLSEETKLLGLLVVTGSAAVVASVVLAHDAIGLSRDTIRTYVSILVLVMGATGLARAKLRTRIEYRPARLAAFALLAGTNKGIGGGGYGPVVTLGQILSGVYEKSAVAITTLAEGIVSFVGVVAFFVLLYRGTDVDLILLPSIFAGGFLAAIVGPYLVRVVPNTVWRYVIPLYAFGIGILGLAFGLGV
ncbi:putative permease [Halovivax ruber XH-70]|uniref:Probable membrane transporter protein n=1 Tax=Halovivax ruber (strain DSM 18193 / JCM 13892 / XH-70) TaxID=797302 RepID=L0IC32_HALRX|nr:sulfite exporter TauE/SafE family protein [Halovivax ruber]AGB15527.1 putative permease [Halovivax ruber XH-70]